MIGLMRTALRLAVLVLVLVCLPACRDAGKQSYLDMGNYETPLPVCYSAPGPPVPGAFSWEAPLWPLDCSSMNAVVGYRVYYGTAPGTFAGSVDVGNTTSVALATLSSAVPGPGSYYLVVTAYDSAGLESAYSNEVLKDL
jgi:hypothetical protein